MFLDSIYFADFEAFLVINDVLEHFWITSIWGVFTSDSPSVMRFAPRREDTCSPLHLAQTFQNWTWSSSGCYKRFDACDVTNLPGSKGEIVCALPQTFSSNFKTPKIGACDFIFFDSFSKFSKLSKISKSITMTDLPEQPLARRYRRWWKSGCRYFQW